MSTENPYGLTYRRVFDAITTNFTFADRLHEISTRCEQHAQLLDRVTKAGARRILVEVPAEWRPGPSLRPDLRPLQFSENWQLFDRCLWELQAALGNPDGTLAEDTVRFRALGRAAATLAEHYVSEPSKLGVSCSFCGHAATADRKVIAGPGVFICNQCVAEAAAALDIGDQDAD